MNNETTGIVALGTGEITESAITPKDRFAGELATAASVAKELNNVIAKQKDKWAVSLRGHGPEAPVYLKVEAWQYLGKAYEYRALLDGPVERDTEEPNAWVARVKIFDKFDSQVGSGDSICGTSDEPRWAKEPTFSRKSMAQTRAISRAYRSCLAWVAVLAGYEATPYEEMESAPPSVPTPNAATSGPPPKPADHDSDATTEELFIPLCPVAGHGPNRLQPAGVGKNSRVPYPPFYTCSVSACNLKPLAINKALADEYNASQAADVFAPVTIMPPDAPEEEPDYTTEELFI